MTAQDFADRLENYHNYYPMGVYMCFFLSPARMRRGQDKEKTHVHTHRSVRVHFFFPLIATVSLLSSCEAITTEIILYLSVVRVL